MWKLADKYFSSRLLLGTSRYPSLEVLKRAIEASGTEILTVSLRRQRVNSSGQNDFWEFIKNTGLTLLPNTAGCRSVKEAVATAQMAREIFGTTWIKVETVGDEETLCPDPFALVEASRILVSEGFEVFPFMTEDLIVAERLLQVGCRILMPWGSPIGSGRGLAHPYALQSLRARFPNATVIVDAGIGSPSHAARAMEMGIDGVLLNTAVAQAQRPQQMARAFSLAVESGRVGYEAGLMPRQASAVPSTPIVGTPFWHDNDKHQ